MPDDKPITPEDEKPTSTLSRLSAVVLFITTIACVVGAVRWAVNSESDPFYENLFLLGEAGWIVFLTAIYISGRYKEVEVECSKVSEKVGMGGWVNGGWFFWMYPLFIALIFGAMFMAGDLLINGVVWLIRLIGGFIRS
jgi:hypothetical protein